MAAKTQQRIEKLIRILSDGQFHSGEEIAGALDISRTAVWKLIKKIELWGIKVFSVRGRGYQISKGLELLDREYILSQINSFKVINKIEVLTSIGSTSDYIAKHWKNSFQGAQVCIAEHQSAGRGRKGQRWISPFAANLYFSLGIQLPLGLNSLGGISIAMGILLCRVIRSVSNSDVEVKWPNDLLMDGKKVAGILVEASGDNHDNSFLNIGIGINWNMKAEQGDNIDQPWANLKNSLKDTMSKDAFILRLLMEMDQFLIHYTLNNKIDPVESLAYQKVQADIIKEWANYSAYYNQTVIIHLGKKMIEGKEVGISSNGALRLMTNKGEKLFHSGEVSLRAKGGTK
ncbi:MAG: biotin--[acetyl-CoA-carboxylase] ligase [Gammaproteobacteria bacterium]|nr:biotin--[acetyl-CoA-carboxylase] ligase [Gammaproteobacteria bacterium]